MREPSWPGSALAISARPLSLWFFAGPVHCDTVKPSTLISGSVPLFAALAADLATLRELSRDGADDFVFRTPAGVHWAKPDWHNYRTRHFKPALERVQAEWTQWRATVPELAALRESVTGLPATRPYDLGRHTHSSLMLAAGMSLQRLARIQGHSIRVLDETYSEELAEFQDREERIDPEAEIDRARRLVWGERDPSGRF